MIKYLILDIDGTLTDGGVYYDDTGNELKKFNTKDGTGIILARMAGITPVVLTGRECAATTRRIRELGVDYLYQGIKDKEAWLNTWMEENGIEKSDIGYIGDDVNDLGPMRLCSYIACPADAIDEVKVIADYVSVVNGGYGVVRDVIKQISIEAGGIDFWNKVLDKVCGVGV